MYESPINVIYEQMKTQIDGDIFQAIQSYGINVDNDELLKALQYDRQQYKKGYADGVKEFAERLKTKVLYEKARNYKGNDLVMGYNTGIDIAIDILDNLVAETVGEENG